MSLAFNFDFSALGGLADSLRSVTGEQLGRRAQDVVNRVITKFDQEQRAAQLADINLQPGYVAEKTKVALASGPVNPRATITTTAGATVMDRFGARPIYRPGDRDKRGRKLGRRQAGVVLPIKRSAPQTELAMFMLPLRNQSGRKGVFVRTTASGGKPVHKYGPSPYQLFKFQIRSREDDLVDDLQRTAVAELGGLLERGLGP